jgi:hypothetical protein
MDHAPRPLAVVLAAIGLTFQVLSIGRAGASILDNRRSFAR